MNKIQGLYGLAMAYCVVHRLMDKDPQMREIWGWFSVVIVALMVITALLSRMKASHSDIASPFKLVALFFQPVAWLCKLIDSPRRKCNWRIGLYYGALELPLLSVFCVVGGMMGPQGILGNPNADQQIVTAVSSLSLACFAFAVLLAISFIIAGNAEEMDLTHSKESSGNPNEGWNARPLVCAAGLDQKTRTYSGDSATISSAPGTYSGIGGWLLLLIVRLWIGTVIRFIGGLGAGLSLVGVFSYGSVALSIVAALLLGFKNARGVTLAKIYLAVDAIYYALSVVDSVLGDGLQVGSSMPPWFKPLGYLIASVLWLVYLFRSQRVKNTYFPTVMQVNAEDMHVHSRRHGWAELSEPMRQANASLEHVPPPKDTPLSRSEFNEITTKLVSRVDERLREMFNNPVDKYRDYVDLLKQHGDPGKIEIIRRHQLSAVTALCEHAYSVHRSPSALHIPDMPNSNGSFPKELQRWAIGVSAIRMSRALDIRAAMEVIKPFELMIKDRDYLLAIVKKNAGGDGTSIGNMDATQYEPASGPEIAYKLMIQANQDMFESEMWAYVAHYAGDEDLLIRYEEVGRIAAGSSLEYWVRYAHPERT